MSTVLILGAGMVGVSTALALRADGHDVVLIDRREPGRETSYGNAGIIQAEAVEPYALPRDIPSLVRIALGRGNDVRYQLAALPGQAQALWGYFRASRRDRHRAISAAYAPMIRRSTTDHQALIAEAGAERLIRRDGFYQIYRSAAALDASSREVERLATTYGVGAETLDARQLERREPALRPGLAGAVRWADPWTCRDPGGLVTAYAELFQRRGGRCEVGDATTLQPAGAGWSVSTQSGRIEAEHAVIALGPWSPDLLRRFGYRFPMVYKRGYHRHFANTGGLAITLHDPDYGMVVSPMEAGVRVATGAELARRDAPATPRQLDRAAAMARQLTELGDPVEAEAWMGRRPCLPGMLPFVGLLPRHRTLWGNFGHGHQGFTLGPTTGRLLADRMAGKP
ncbi:FAD-dependent oxidoreductase [Mesorhizobium sp. BAC0120]|uniref:NAD(P)/FAD-dependent oxidoreductase n=1 Tax=Mesorhizobium sp. BAC0120 TaxID=3090670 RepID=UPI00298C1118|nr:FAD-dependent oxidoreductase [Mesorhizobium sp. BAC0120]MDW6020147.1 FAD-dependent oxidoreductase [Mesorhizobium sp. BAC0120]